MAVTDLKPIVISYEAPPTGKLFHNSQAFVRGIRGPIGCVAGDTEVITSEGPLQISRITRSMLVLSYDQSSGQFRFVQASAAFPKGKDVLYRVQGPHGEWRGAAHHRVLCEGGKYQRLDILYQQGSFSAPLCSAFLKRKRIYQGLKSWLSNVRRYWKIDEGFWGRCVSLFRQYDPQLHLAANHGQASCSLRPDAQRYAEAWSVKEHNHQGQPCGRRARQGSVFLTVDRRDDSSRDAQESCERSGKNTQGVQILESMVDGSVQEFDPLSCPYSYSVTNGITLQITRCTEQEVYWDIQVPGTHNYVTVDGCIHHNSGKSVVLMQEIFRIGMLQQPQADGIRRTRWAVIRNTYPELRSTTINTFLDWFGDISTIKYDSPIEAVLKVDDIQIQIYFMALDKPKDIKKLKSLELTGVAINEASEIPKDVLDMATGRVGRYPAERDGGITRACVIMDTNPPDTDHWWYKLFEEQRPESYEEFSQPPALLRLMRRGHPVYVPNPDAENVKHQPLRYKYWLQQIAGKSQQWINVYVMGQYGTAISGRPCYPNYNDDVHCSKVRLEASRDMPLLLGWDYGRTPACIIGQLTPKGQLRIIEEILIADDGPGMGIRQFTRDVVKPHLLQHYPGFETIFSWGDPSGGYGSDRGEENCYDIQEQEGIPTQSALTNAPELRLENVEYFLTRMIDGEPGFLLDPRCQTLRKGFLGAYQFERIQVGGDESRYRDTPKKNRYSHAHDGCQYLADLARNGVVKVSSKQHVKPVVEGLNSKAWT